MGVLFPCPSGKEEPVCHDYVCAEYKNSYRNGDNFIGSDCLPVDCDNDHSENPDDWVTPDDIMQAFPGVSFAIHYSRYNNREKNGKAARPKFHVLFPIEYVSDSSLYSDMKRLVNSIFPYFDTQALDAARFFFGTTTADVALYPGRMNLTEFLDEDLFDEDLPDGQYDGSSIPEGSRNATMSRFAGRVIKKYGDSDKAYQTFMEESTSAHLHWKHLSSLLSGTVPSVFMQDSPSRTATLHRKYITTLPVTNRETSPMLDRLRC